MLDEIVVHGKPNHAWKEWHYLTKEERSALIEAYKAMRRGQFDKRIMERVFDDKFYERQEAEFEAMKAIRRGAMAMQRSPLQGTALINAQPGSFQPIPSQNTGLLSGISAALGLK